MELYGCAKVSTNEVVVDPDTAGTKSVMGVTVSFDGTPGSVTPYTWPSQQAVVDWIESRENPGERMVAIFGARRH